MTKDELTARAGQINTEMIQCRANYAKLEGHLAEVTHWLQDHEKNAMAESETNDAATMDFNDGSEEENK